ncbi:hypothetical protein H4582DRAFT_1589640 [Lactarius indigo]|nr:hypothetical protein H4582DRAFT_1589640 [Lactarius indigo]
MPLWGCGPNSARVPGVCDSATHEPHGDWAKSDGVPLSIRVSDTNGSYLLPPSTSLSLIFVQRIMRDPIINDTENCVVVSPAARTEGEAVYHQPVLASSEFSSDSINNWHPRTSAPHVRGSSCVAYTYTSAATLDTRTCTLTLTSQRATGGPMAAALAPAP